MNTALTEYPELNNFFSYHCGFLRKIKRDNFRADTQFILANLSASPQPEVNGLSTPVLKIHLCLTQKSAECPIIRYERQMDCQDHILGPDPITQLVLGEVLGHTLRSSSREPRGSNIPASRVYKCLRKQWQEKLWVLAHCPTHSQCATHSKLEGRGHGVLIFRCITCFCIHLICLCRPEERRGGKTLRGGKNSSLYV